MCGLFFSNNKIKWDFQWIPQSGYFIHYFQVQERALRIVFKEKTATYDELL